MHASRMKPETHWTNVGATVAKQHGSLADLDRVKTGRPVIDGWIITGYERTIRRDAAKAQRLAKSNS